MAAGEKTAEELRQEIEELERQQKEIDERINAPRVGPGLRARLGPIAPPAAADILNGRGSRGGVSAFGNNGRSSDIGLREDNRDLPSGRIRPGGVSNKNLDDDYSQPVGSVRKGVPYREEHMPPMKKRLLSFVVKVGGEDGENGNMQDAAAAEDAEGNKRAVQSGGYGSLEGPRYSSSGADHGERATSGGARAQTEIAAPQRKALLASSDPSLITRNKRMFGALLGTLRKFDEEDKKFKESDTAVKRMTSLQRAEMRSQEESKRLRLQEKEAMEKKRKADLELKARLAAKTEEKNLELLFLEWTNHQRSLIPFLLTQAQPPVLFTPAKECEATEALRKQREVDFEAWKAARRAELTEYQKNMTEEMVANAGKEPERRPPPPQFGAGGPSRRGGGGRFGMQGRMGTRNGGRGGGPWPREQREGEVGGGRRLMSRLNREEDEPLAEEDDERKETARMEEETEGQDHNDDRRGKGRGGEDRDEDHEEGKTNGGRESKEREREPHDLKEVREKDWDQPQAGSLEGLAKYGDDDEDAT